MYVKLFQNNDDNNNKTKTHRLKPKRAPHVTPLHGLVNTVGGGPRRGRGRRGSHDTRTPRARPSTRGEGVKYIVHIGNVTSGVKGLSIMCILGVVTVKELNIMCILGVVTVKELNIMCILGVVTSGKGLSIMCILGVVTSGVKGLNIMCILGVVTVKGLSIMCILAVVTSGVNPSFTSDTSW